MSRAWRNSTWRNRMSLEWRKSATEEQPPSKVLAATAYSIFITHKKRVATGIPRALQAKDVVLFVPTVIHDIMKKSTTKKKD